jgi:tetratricopeptide (TPR) repeat protein
MGDRRQVSDSADGGQPDSHNLLFGDTSGLVVQAGAIHGDVNIRPTVSDTGPVVPRQLLPVPARFTGRAGELTQLRDIAANAGPTSPAVIVLRGPGGVGKTALALRWLGEVAARFPHGNLYADLALSTGQPVAPEDVLGHFLRALGVAPQRIPTGLAERTALYRSVTAGVDLVVLLDNAVSAAQAKVLLPAGPGSLAVMTSRRPLLGLLAVGAHIVPLEPLEPASALELLTRTIGAERVRVERADAERLTAMCGGLPIALCVAGARIASRPRRSLARMIDELRDERARLDVLSSEGDLSVRATFDVAYGDLSPPLRRVYRTLGLQPGKTFGIEVVAAGLGTDIRTTRRAFDELIDASLLEELVDGDYRLHDLVRVHALDQALAEDSDEERSTTVLNVLRWYLFAAQAANRAVMPARRVLTYDIARPVPEFTLPPGIDDHTTALAWLADHRAGLVAATHDAAKYGWAELAYHLSDVLRPLFILHHHERDSLEIGEAALRAAEEWGNTAAQTSAQKRLGRTYLHLGRLDRARYHATELLRRAQAHHDRRAEASALKNLAQLHAANGDPEHAAATFEQVIAILLALHKGRDEALARIELADVHLAQANTEAAMAQTRRARDTLLVLSPPDPYNAARATSRLGQAYLLADDLGPAQEFLQQAISVLAAQEAGRERGQAHRALAELGRRTGDDAPLPDLVQHLRSRHRLLDAGSHGDNPELRAVFGWSADALPADANRLFCLLGLHPSTRVTTQAAAALAEWQAERTERAFDRLVDANLVDQHGVDSYRVHDLLDQYAGDRAESRLTPEDRRTAVHRQVDWYLGTSIAAVAKVDPHRRPVPPLELATSIQPQTFDDGQQALAWCIRERSQVLAVTESAIENNFHEHVWRLVATFDLILNSFGDPGSTVELHRAALNSARISASRFGEACLENNLGAISFYLGQYENAARSYTKALTIVREIEGEWAESSCLFNIGTTLLERGMYAKAIEFYRQSLAIAERLDDKDVQARVYHRIGEVHQRWEQPVEAERFYQRSLAIRIQHNDARNQPTTLAKLGELCIESGDPRRAIEYCERALKISRDNHDFRKTAETLSIRGAAQYRLGAHDESITSAAEAAALCHTMSDLRGQARALEILAQAQQANGEQETADHNRTKALALIEGSNDPMAIRIRTAISSSGSSVDSVPIQREESSTRPISH